MQFAEFIGNCFRSIPWQKIEFTGIYLRFKELSQFH